MLSVDQLMSKPFKVVPEYKRCGTVLPCTLEWEIPGIFELPGLGGFDKQAPNVDCQYL